MSDDMQLRELNEQYVAAFMNADVRWYERHLDEEFVCIESDGSVLGKEEFLRAAAKGPDVVDYHLDEVRVRLYGYGADVAIVQATGSFKRRDGSAGTSRYIDVYVRRGREWKVVSAQITRAHAS